MTTRYFLPLPAAAAEGPTGWTPPNYSILDTGFLDTEFLDTEFWTQNFQTQNFSGSLGFND